ncbi:hypothetical protein BESB_063260 [Besnoitia besnoiti]|uniref:Uncharacterized protein n=1 Tax=Besnoitia besnoiti TaxID=94643 RepID=A0A2A9MC41_BESBE|nr:hypothetical protein BESB_063260 [Besnoitia besnoiti]PFH35439.1 hypothetical protein BESB_063260 [Besnoitia besnoiti]
MVASAASSSSSPPSSDFVFPPFFPLVRPGCENQADALFACFDAANVPGAGPTTVAGLAQCRDSAKLYEACTKKSLADPKVPLPIVFVEFQPGSQTQK